MSTIDNYEIKPTARRARHDLHQRRTASWQAGRGSRWLLHITILITVGLASLLSWNRNGGTVSADNPVVAGENVWLSQPGPEAYSPTEPEFPKGDDTLVAQSLARSTAVPSPTVAPTDTPIISATPTTAATPVPSPTSARPIAPQNYLVEAGDTVSGIATKFGVSADTIRWANGLANPNSLYVGQTLTVLPISGVSHLIKEGDSLTGIADLHDVSVTAIADYNDVAPDELLQVGSTLLIPGAKPLPAPTPTPKPTATPAPTPTRVSPTSTPVPPTPTAPPAPAARPAAAQTQAAAIDPAPTATPVPRGNGQLAWPAKGLLTQLFVEGGHKGIDIAAPIGTPVWAATDGKVVTLQRVWDYGLYLEIDHGDGMRTLYSHLNNTTVKLGDTVKVGQQVGAIGTTGEVTGPNVHFELRINNKLVDPLNYLP